jgi:hypothetical protein
MATIDAGACCLGPVFLAIGLLMIYGGAARFLLYQKIKDTPTSKVRSAAIGLVELAGKAVCREDMSSPVSRAKCVYWRLKGEYYVPGKNGGWRTLLEKSTSSKFLLGDETGQMLIEPDGAEINIPSDFESAGFLTEGGGILGMMKRKTLDPKVLSFLETDADAKSKFLSRSGYELKMTEYFIAEGDPLFVLGTASEWKTGSPEHYQDLIVSRGRDKTMFISDSNEYKALESVRNSILITLAIGFVCAAIGLYVVLMMFGV